MFEKYKKTLIFSFIAILVLVVSFLYVFFNITKKDNRYIEEKKRTEYAKNEAETQLFFNQLKKEVNKSFLTTQKGTFNVYNKEISGWKVIFTEMNEELSNKLYKYFTDNKFSLNSQSTDSNKIYDYGSRTCVINLQNKTVGVYCGYTK